MEVVPKQYKPPDLSLDIIKAIISFIIINSKIINGEVTPVRGVIIQGAEKFNYSMQTIGQIWKRQKPTKNPDVAAFTASPEQKGQAEGKWIKWNREHVKLAIVQLSYHHCCLQYVLWLQH
jgi:hypothetical protein